MQTNDGFRGEGQGFYEELEGVASLLAKSPKNIVVIKNMFEKKMLSHMDIQYYLDRDEICKRYGCLPRDVDEMDVKDIEIIRRIVSGANKVKNDMEFEEKEKNWWKDNTKHLRNGKVKQIGKK